jgi:hypothetical protein
METEKLDMVKVLEITRECFEEYVRKFPPTSLQKREMTCARFFFLAGMAYAGKKETGK